MTTTVSYEEAQARFADLLRQVVEDQDTVIIKRRGRKNVVMISEAELSGLETTIHLLSSPANAKRLLEAIESSRRGEGIQFDSIDDLKRAVGLEGEEA